MYTEQYKFKCSVSVIPIVTTEKRYIDIIQKSMQKVIPYIEELTQVRYYPVTTYIVDDYTVKSQYEEATDSKREALILEDIEEVLKFLSWIAIGYHTQRFYSNVAGLDYMDFSNLTQEQLEELKRISEGMCYYFEKYLNDKDSVGRDELYIKGISKDIDVIRNFFDDFEEILKIFKNISSTVGYEDIRLKYEEEKIYPKLEVWKNNLANRSFGVIKKYIEFEGKWTNRLSDLIKVAEITLQMLKKMMEKLEVQMNEFSYIIKEMHTYGVYLHKNEGSNAQFAQILRLNGLPECIEQFNAGKVLICIDKIIQRAYQIHEANPNLDKDWLIESFITAVLVHEHTHAANFEGVRYNHSQPLFASSINKNDYKYDVVYEALAEWAEFHYFRSESIISEIIKSHMNNGEIKNWPYAGAALIENRFNELGVTDFQVIFNMSRVCYKNAYEILK